MKGSFRLALLAAGIVALAACFEEQPTASDATDLTPQLAKFNADGFRTSAALQAALQVDGEMIALATAGDVMPGSGAQLAGIPDGIGSFGGKRYMESYLNHEISGASRVSRFTIDTKTGKIVYHDYTIDGSEGYNRLCSASWNDAGDGFPGGYFFTGEESSDGLQLAIDRQGNVTQMPHIGYYAHEQQVAVPGFRSKTVIVNFDDDGTSGSNQESSNSELYMYVSRNSWGTLSGEGQLYVFASDDETNVGDMSEGETTTGHWIAVPEAIALQKDGPGGRPLLNSWVDEPEHDAFDFTRLEDGFYDKVAKRNNDNPALYIFDTGDPSLGPSSDPWDKWGSIYRMEWQDRRDPAGETTLTLLARSSGPSSGWASPDNGDMNANGVIMLQEDPAAGPWTRDETRIYAFERAADGSLVNNDGTLVIETVGSECASSGFCWETSGIEDASSWFGDNAWIFDVQSKRPPQVDCDFCATDGQLLLVRIGGELPFD